MDLANLNKYISEINKLGASLITISPELPEYSRKIIDAQRLDFDILFDKGNEVANKFGLRYFMPDYLIELYKNSFNLNLEESQGDTQWSLPIPGRFLVDRDGFIRYAEGEPDYTMRPDPEELLDVLKAIK